uniref:Arrestin-like N-terminal domain-containing protein n=1 Tax=Sinocyclocheilus anshuiensis TaxID=1608454 RepID=A0A671QEM5_9TELE
MGKLQEFEITFTNNKVVYNPGESISGTVRIKTSQSLQFKAIKVNCVGSCGISSKLNDASWMLEEKYLSSTLSVGDKGKEANFHIIQFLLSFSSEIQSFLILLSKYFYSTTWIDYI